MKNLTTPTNINALLYLDSPLLNLHNLVRQEGYRNLSTVEKKKFWNDSFQKNPTEAELYDDEFFMSNKTVYIYKA